MAILNLIESLLDRQDDAIEEFYVEKGKWDPDVAHLNFCIGRAHAYADAILRASQVCPKKYRSAARDMAGEAWEKAGEVSKQYHRFARG